VKLIGFKVMTSRVRDYMGYVQFPMIAYLFLVQTGYDLLVAALLAVAGCAVLAVVDWKIVYPAEQAAVTNKNPEWLMLIEKVDRIERRLVNYLDGKEKGLR